MFPKRWLVVGLDSATPTFLSSEDHPFLRQIWHGGISGVLRSTTPPLTPIAWTTIMSGRSPSEHGVYGFRKGDGAIFSSADVTVPRLWELVRPSHSLFFPLVYPVRKFSRDDGFVAATAVVRKGEGMVRCVSDGRMARFIVEHSIPSSPGDIEALFKSFMHRLRAWAKILRDDSFPWRFSAVMLPELDTVMHFHWESQARLFKALDAALANIWEENNDGDMGIVLVSDHGSTRVAFDFDPVTWARENLTPREFSKIKIDGWGNLWCRDVGLCLKIERGLESFEYEGQRILDVWRGEQIFSGVNGAPDLVVWPARELGFSQQPNSGRVIAPATKSGCHLFDGVVAFWWPGVESRRIMGEAVDFAPTMMHLLGKNIPGVMSGRVLV